MAKRLVDEDASFKSLETCYNIFKKILHLPQPPGDHLDQAYNVARYPVGLSDVVQKSSHLGDLFAEQIYVESQIAVEQKLRAFELLSFKHLVNFSQKVENSFSLLADETVVRSPRRSFIELREMAAVIAQQVYPLFELRMKRSFKEPNLCLDSKFLNVGMTLVRLSVALSHLHNRKIGSQYSQGSTKKTLKVIKEFRPVAGFPRCHQGHYYENGKQDNECKRDSRTRRKVLFVLTHAIRLFKVKLILVEGSRNARYVFHSFCNHETVRLCVYSQGKAVAS